MYGFFCNLSMFSNFSETEGQGEKELMRQKILRNTKFQYKVLHVANALPMHYH